MMPGKHNEIALDSLAADIRAEHDAVRAAAETTAQHAIRCGQLLIEAKDGLPHGEWLPWLQEHCALSERTAQAYTRLARKHGELNDAKAQRVADLPVREAMKAVADQRAENPTPDEADADFDVWAWAERQVSGPLNLFDFDNPACARNKLHSQLGISSTISFCILMSTGKIPALRLAPWEDILKAIELLIPLAKGQIGDLDIDCSGVDAVTLFAVLKLNGQRDLGFLFHELEYREKQYKDSPDTWADKYEVETATVHKAMLADLDKKMAALENGEGAA